MEEVNDVAFRLMCKKAGAGATWTGMIHPQNPQKIYLTDKPVLQLFCTTPRGIKEFMKKYDKKVIAWDFNLGCPAKTAKKHGFGSALRDLKKIDLILKTIRENTKKPVGMKFRKSDYTFDLLKIAEKYCDFVTIHPRTQSQGYSGTPDVEFAEQIKKSTKLPVIYSGNVEYKNAKEFLKKFDYVMIGREAIGRPEIFSKLTNTKYKMTFKNYINLSKKFKLYFRQIKFQAMNFTKGKRDSAKLRLKLFECKNVESVEKVFNEFINP